MQRAKKSEKIFLQSVAGFAKCRRLDKVWQVLRSVEGCTKCGRYLQGLICIAKCDRYCKV